MGQTNQKTYITKYVQNAREDNVLSCEKHTFVFVYSVDCTYLSSVPPTPSLSGFNFSIPGSSNLD